MTHILELIGLIIAILGLVIASYNMINIIYEKHLIRREKIILQNLQDRNELLRNDYK